jgi:hypothetical protein
MWRNGLSILFSEIMNMPFNIPTIFSIDIFY